MIIRRGWQQLQQFSSCSVFCLSSVLVVMQQVVGDCYVCICSALACDHWVQYLYAFATPWPLTAFFVGYWRQFWNHPNSWFFDFMPRKRNNRIGYRSCFCQDWHSCCFTCFLFLRINEVFSFRAIIFYNIIKYENKMFFLLVMQWRQRSGWVPDGYF